MTPVQEANALLAQPGGRILTSEEVDLLRYVVTGLERHNEALRTQLRQVDHMRRFRQPPEY